MKNIPPISKLLKKINFFIFLFFPFVCLAQNFNVEIAKTESSPGFFMVKILPEPMASPLVINNIFVKNFPENKKEIYDPLIINLKKSGKKIIEKDKLKESLLIEENRIIFLGEAYKNFLVFTASEEKNILDEFDNFYSLYLDEPIFFQNVSVDFGGNISETYPSKINFLDTKNNFFIGKFEKNLKTRFEINGTSADGIFSASLDIDFQNDKLVDEVLSPGLASEWENLWKNENTNTRPKWNLALLALFPWLLGGGGILIILLAIISWLKEKNKTQNLDENLLDISPSEEKNIPLGDKPKTPQNNFPEKNQNLKNNISNNFFDIPNKHIEWKNIPQNLPFEGK